MNLKGDNSDPNGIHFYDAASSRDMLLVQQADHDFDGWVCFRHPDGGWVSLRPATPDDIAKLATYKQAGFRVRHRDIGHISAQASDVRSRGAQPAYADWEEPSIEDVAEALLAWSLTPEKRVVPDVIIRLQAWLYHSGTVAELALKSKCNLRQRSRTAIIKDYGDPRLWPITARTVL